MTESREYSATMTDRVRVVDTTVVSEYGGHKAAKARADRELTVNAVDGNDCGHATEHVRTGCNHG
jgi:hypothetical protein